MNFLPQFFRRNSSTDPDIKKPPMLFDRTQVLIDRVRNFYGADVITYWGAHISEMAHNDLVVFREVLRSSRKSDRLFLFVKSSGGSGKVALRLTHLLRSLYRELIVLAPLECASAATMLALGADQIKMGPSSFLTAIDTSIIHELSPVDVDGDLVNVNQNELDRVMKLWNQQKRNKEKNPYTDLYKYIHPLVFGAVDRASSLSIQLTNEILSYHMDDVDQINSISHHLNAEYPSHGYPITARAAARLGLPVEALEPEVEAWLVELNGLYSTMAQPCETDFDEYKYHDNQIYTLVEAAGTQIYYQRDKDMLWRTEDKQWITMNNRSGWFKIGPDGRRSPFHIR